MDEFRRAMANMGLQVNDSLPAEGGEQEDPRRQAMLRRLAQLRGEGAPQAPLPSPGERPQFDYQPDPASLGRIQDLSQRRRGLATEGFSGKDFLGLLLFGDAYGRHAGMRRQRGIQALGEDLEGEQDALRSARADATRRYGEEMDVWKPRNLARYQAELKQGQPRHTAYTDHEAAVLRQVEAGTLTPEEAIKQLRGKTAGGTSFLEALLKLKRDVDMDTDLGGGQ